MERSRGRDRPASGAAQRAAAVAERGLRLLADARLAVALLLAAALANAVAAAVPEGQRLLDSPLYRVLLGAVLVCGVAGVGVRLPAAWREWRNPAALPAGAEPAARVAARDSTSPASRAAVVGELRRAGYRVLQRGSGMRWSAAGVRRGWSRFAGLGSHFAIVLVIIGALAGGSLGGEVRFSLLVGQQALLDEARPGFSDSVRFDRFDAAFGLDDRPTRLDTHVTFLRDGEPRQEALLQVNRPGEFGGYLVHAWEYGPAARVQVTTLGGAPLVDAPLALDTMSLSGPTASLPLPTLGLELRVTLIDPARNILELALAGASGGVDSVQLFPGGEGRLGQVRVSHAGLESYVTFLSRRDPGLWLVYGGGVLLVTSIAISLWLPRRRVTVRPAPGGGELVVSMRTDRFDRPVAALEDLARRLARAAGAG